MCCLRDTGPRGCSGRFPSRMPSPSWSPPWAPWGPGECKTGSEASEAAALGALDPKAIGALEQGAVVERRHEAEEGMTFGPRDRAVSLDVVHQVFVSPVARAPARPLSVALSERDDEDREERPPLLVEEVGGPSRVRVREPGADEVDAGRRIIRHRHAEPDPLAEPRRTLRSSPSPSIPRLISREWPTRSPGTTARR